MTRMTRALLALAVGAALLAVAFSFGLRMPSAADFSDPQRLVDAVSGKASPVRGDTLTGRSDDYAFFRVTRSGAPVRWNPCVPIHYRVNTANATAGALDDVKDAVARVSKATGLTFVYDGPSTRIPTSAWDRSSGNPVLIAWATPQQTDLLAAEAAGNGGAGRLGDRYATGSVVLNANHNDLYTPGGGPGGTRVNLIAHELGHLVGLDHAAHPGQVMYGEVGDQTPDGFAAGDLAGLARLGGCH